MTIQPSCSRCPKLAIYDFGGAFLCAHCTTAMLARCKIVSRETVAPATDTVAPASVPEASATVPGAIPAAFPDLPAFLDRRSAAA